MCRLACCFAARICNKYLNHMIWPMKFGLSLHLHPFFLVWFAKALARLRKCAASPDIRCSHMRCFSWTSLKILAWAFILIPSFLGIRCSHMRLVPNVLELALNIWRQPSSTSLLFRDWLAKIWHIPSFKCNYQRLWRHCAKVQPREIICCSLLWYVSWTCPKNWAWAFI